MGVGGAPPHDSEAGGSKGPNVKDAARWSVFDRLTFSWMNK